MHTDAAQAAGKLPVNVDVLSVDLLTLAFHKLYGPKGIGALYVRQGTPLKPILFGAGQEHGMRPGTENVALIVGAGETARLARERLPQITPHLHALREQLWQRLSVGAPGETCWPPPRTSNMPPPPPLSRPVGCTPTLVGCCSICRWCRYYSSRR